MKSELRYQPGDKIGDRYLVHQTMVGGMGEVYLCLDLESDYPIALKTFQYRYIANPKLRSAFENEIAVWIALEKHPNIVRCFYMKIIDNQPFMVIEWIAGEEGKGSDLWGWLRYGPLDLRQALGFTIDICRGLIHAQEKQPGIVHRDLKPENIMVAQGRIAKITDFGLAQIAKSAELKIAGVEGDIGSRQSLLGQNGIFGSPPYMAPEQWCGEVLDARTDIYAVGCILYELLTGDKPFLATKWDDLRRQHLVAKIPKFADSQIPSGSLNGLLACCLAKRRNERFAKVSDLLRQLELIYQQQFSEEPKTIPISDKFTVEDYYNRGSTYGELQLYEKALADFDRAIQLDPNDATIYTNRGVIYHKLQHYTDALADQSRAIEIDSNYARAYTNRGNAHYRLEQYDEALTDYDRAIQLDPNYALAYMSRGLLYKSLHSYNEEEALADFNKAIELDPTLPQAHHNRGEHYYRLRRYEEALADYTQAIKFDPTAAITYNDRGAIYLELQRYEEALTDFNQAIEFDPTIAQPHTNRGLIYLELQRYEEALTDFNQAIELDPTYAVAYTNRGVMYYNLHRYEEALADFDRVIQLDPTDVNAYMNRGKYYSDLHHYEEALADYTQAIKLDPAFTPAYFALGTLFVDRGLLRDSLPYFEKAAQIGDPGGRKAAKIIRKMLKKQKK